MTRDYAWLLTALPKLLNKSAKVIPVEDLLAFGEADLEAALNDRRMEETIEYAVSGKWAQLPEDFKDVLALTCDGQEVVWMAPASFDLHPVRDDKPDAYTLMGNGIHFNVTDSAMFDMRLSYARGLCALSNTRKSDWLQCARPAARLYAAAVHAAPYLEDDARIGTWEHMRDAEIAAITSTQPSKRPRSRANPMFLQMGRNNR